LTEDFELFHVVMLLFCLFSKGQLGPVLLLHSAYEDRLGIRACFCL